MNRTRRTALTFLALTLLAGAAHAQPVRSADSQSPTKHSRKITVASVADGTVLTPAMQLDLLQQNTDLCAQQGKTVANASTQFSAGVNGKIRAISTCE